MGTLRGQEQPLAISLFKLYQQALQAGDGDGVESVLHHVLARSSITDEPAPARAAVACAGAWMVKDLRQIRGKLRPTSGLLSDRSLDDLSNLFNALFEGEEATVRLADERGRIVVEVAHHAGDRRVVETSVDRIAGSRWTARISGSGTATPSTDALMVGGFEANEWLQSGLIPHQAGALSWPEACRIWRSCFVRIWRRALLDPQVPPGVRQGAGAGGKVLIASISDQVADPHWVPPRSVLEKWDRVFGGIAEGCRVEAVLGQDDGTLLDVVIERGVRRVLSTELAEVTGDALTATIEAIGEVVDVASPIRGKVGRNAPCPCGSGRKYKRCCGA